MSPDDQLAHKQRVLLELLEHQSGVAPRRVLDPLRGPTLGYRGKARLAVRYVAGKGALVGFREQDGRHLTDMRECPVLHPAIGNRIGDCRRLIDALTVRQSVPQIEVAVAGTRVALVFRHLQPLPPSDRERLQAFASATGFDIWLQPGGPDSAAPLGPMPPPLAYTVDAVTLEFLPMDFTQVNAAINGAMVAGVIDLLELDGDDVVLDLFCGIGNFTLPIARRARRVVGIEGDARLVARATANARANGIGNAVFRAADLAGDAIRIPPAMLPDVRKIVVDPPRTGAEALIAEGEFRAIERLVYISCNPSTLARDARTLVQRHGLRLAAAGVVDMFPHTAHVEAMALFTRD
jgi:23S rRNA (uracil1939-C5)-methyltransferase